MNRNNPQAMRITMKIPRFLSCLCLLALVGCNQSNATPTTTEAILPAVENQSEILEQVSVTASEQQDPGAAPTPPSAAMVTRLHMAPPEMNISLPKLPDAAFAAAPMAPCNAGPQPNLEFATVPSLAPSGPNLHPEDPLTLQMPVATPLPQPSQMPQPPLLPKIGPPANLVHFGPPAELQNMAVKTLTVTSAAPDQKSN
jgi:hypothetical protein